MAYIKNLKYFLGRRLMVFSMTPLHAVFMLAPVALAAIFVASPAFAQWSPQGVTLVASPVGFGFYPQICSDGQDGAFVAWSDQRDQASVISQNAFTTYVSHVNARGEVTEGIPANGARIPPVLVPFSLNPADMVPDGAGGCYLAVHVDTTGFNLHVGYLLFRLRPDCTTYPGWPAQGVRLFNSERSVDVDLKLYHDATHDGVLAIGPALTAGVEDTIRVRVQHIRGDGTLDPLDPIGGRRILRKGGDEAGGRGIYAEPDGHGGLFIATQGRYLYLQHILADGTISPGFGPLGNAMPFGDRFSLVGIAPSHGGLLIAGYWSGLAAVGGITDMVFYDYGVDSLGRVRPAWAAGPTQLTVDDYALQNNPHATSDGFGGMFLTWADDRNYAQYGVQVNVERIGPDGAPSPGWISGGVPIALNPGFDYTPGGGSCSVPDATGGVYVEFTRSGVGTLASHMVSPGTIAPSWSPLGEQLVTGYSSDNPFTSAICPDGQGGAIVAVSGIYGALLVQHVGADAPVAAEATLASSDAQPDHVALRWRTSTTLDGAASIERDAADGAWTTLGTALPDGQGDLRFEDHSVTPGARYDYRLRYRSGGIERVSAATWITVPNVVRFALHGAWPDPAPRGGARIAFALEGDAPARLELYGVDGARRMEREVAGLGAGEHVLPLDASSPLPPGLYWLRLTQGSRHASARMVIVGQ